MEEGECAFKILTGKPSEKIPITMRSDRWVDNIRMDLKEIGVNTRNCVNSAKDRDYWRALLNEALHLRIS